MKFTVRSFGCMCRDPGSNQGPLVLQSDAFSGEITGRLSSVWGVYSILRLRARDVLGIVGHGTCASFFSLYCCHFVEKH